MVEEESLVTSQSAVQKFLNNDDEPFLWGIVLGGYLNCSPFQMLFLSLSILLSFACYKLTRKFKQTEVGTRESNGPNVCACVWVDGVLV